jgi:hypothetical protein
MLSGSTGFLNARWRGPCRLKRETTPPDHAGIGVDAVTNPPPPGLIREKTECERKKSKAERWSTHHTLRWGLMHPEAKASETGGGPPVCGPPPQRKKPRRPREGDFSPTQPPRRTRKTPPTGGAEESRERGGAKKPPVLLLVLLALLGAWPGRWIPGQMCRRRRGPQHCHTGRVRGGRLASLPPQHP